MSSPPVPPETARILDAALAQFGDVGIRRSTIGDVARRAGVDRVTVYRRVGSKDELIQAVVAREAQAVFEQIATAASAGESLADRITEGFATAGDIARTHPLWRRLIVLEPETMLRPLSTEGGPLLATACEAAMAVFTLAAADGLIDGTDGLEQPIEVAVRVVHSLLLTPSIEGADDPDLRTFARRCIVPLFAA